MGLGIAIALIGLLTAYLFGSIPTGFLLAKALKGIDIREHGSGNTGATNVFRVVGKGAGITALVIDLLKGVAAVLFMYWLLPFATSSLFDAASLGANDLIGENGGVLTYGNSPEGQAYFLWRSWLSMLAALCAVIGHSKSVWLGFTGGKSAATSLGVLLALSWPVALSVAAVFATALGISRTVSVGSIAAALSAFIFMVALQQPLAYILLALSGGAYVVYLHRSNISRLMSGTEPKTFGS
ncbi:MAG: glycerol-3-phosphate 1-O-acyltransferase PlsY [Cyanobacteria bacterium J06650_10]